MKAIRVLAAVCCASGLAPAQQAVDVVRVTATSAERKIALPGEFAPYQAVDVHAKVTGFVEKVLVDRGSAVKQGELLATLVAPELKAQRLEAEAKVQAAAAQGAEAQAKLLAAQSTWERLRAASRTPGAVAGNELVIAEKAVDAARAQVAAVESLVKAAESSVAALRDMESYLRVTAPFSGIVTERNVHPGALVGPTGQPAPMFRLEQNSRLRLVVAVPEVDVAGIVRGSRVTFTVPAWPEQSFSGVVARVAHSMDSKTRSMAVELDVANPRGVLAPGMYPTVNWPVRRARPVLMVPASAVVTTTERTFVIRVRDGVLEWVDVSKGVRTGDMVEVRGPLAAGDPVVQRASDEMRPGTRIAPRIARAAKTS
jgi:RND family efflux transporter MFP subunit